MIKTFILVAVVSVYVCDAESGIDWRQKGVVLPVKKQDKCLSAGTINVLDMISAYRTIRDKKKLEAMSAQELFNCNPDWCICNTTIDAYQAFTSIREKMPAIETESEHPFTGQCDHRCDREVIKKSGFKFSSYSDYDPTKPEDCEEFFNDYLKREPFVVYIKSDCNAFQTYSGDVLDTEEDTKDKPLDHSLLLVGDGYGYTKDGKEVEYWLARNSYGENWGEKGYIRLEKGKNICGFGLGYIAIGS